jgi:hypothetical protein
MLATLCPSYPPLPDDLRQRVLLEVSDAVLRHRSLMPIYLKWPLSALGLVFQILPCFWKGRFYDSLEPSEQASYLSVWERSPLAVFVHLHRSLVVLTFLDHPQVKGALDKID